MKGTREPPEKLKPLGEKKSPKGGVTPKPAPVWRPVPGKPDYETDGTRIKRKGIA